MQLRLLSAPSLRLAATSSSAAWSPSPYNARASAIGAHGANVAADNLSPLERELSENAATINAANGDQAFRVLRSRSARYGDERRLEVAAAAMEAAGTAVVAALASLDNLSAAAGKSRQLGDDLWGAAYLGACNYATARFSVCTS